MTVSRLAATLHAPHRHVRAIPRWMTLIVCLAALLVLMPLVSLALDALQGDPDLWPHLAANVLPASLKDTALLLIGVAIVAGSIGVVSAWLVTAHQFPGREALRWLLPLPLAMPTYITAYIYVEIFDSAGPVQMGLRGLMGWTSRGDYWFPEIRSLPGCIFVMSVVLYPYVYIAARAMFLTQSASMIEVARTLSAGPFRLFRVIAMPLARPALAVGLALALLEALNDIGASEYLGVRTLTVSVFTTWLNRGSLPGAAQIAWLMLTVVILLFALERFGRRDRRYALPTRRPRVTQPIRLPRMAGWIATLLCTLPVLMGFVLTFGFLLREVLRRDWMGLLTGDFLGHLMTTLTVSSMATVVTLGVGIVIVTASRLSRSRFMGAAKAITGLGYAIPGTVLALGLLTPLAFIDNSLGDFWRMVTGARIGLLIMGTTAAIVIAYLIRFLPIAVGSLSAGLDRVSPGLEDAGRILGASPRDLVWKVQLPLIRPALAGAALLIFVDCIKELSATLLLRPLNVETLATLIYGNAARGYFEDGSFAALVIVLIGLLPVIQLVRSAETPRRAPPAS